MMPYGDMVITWTNFDISLKVFCGMHLRAIPQVTELQISVSRRLF